MSTFNGLVAEFPDVRGKPGLDLFLTLSVGLLEFLD